MTEEKKRNTRPLPRQGWAQRLSNRQTMIGLIIVSLILIVISALAGWLLLKDQFGLGSKSPPITLAPSLTEIIDQYPELETILSDPKLDSVYKEFLVTYQKGGPEAAYELAKKRGLLNKDDEVVLTLELDTTDTDALKVELEANGIKVTATSENFMDIAIPLAVLEQSLDSDKPGSLLESITGIDHIIRIRMPIPSLETGMLLQEVTTESLEVIGVYNWHNQGFTGKGIKKLLTYLGKTVEEHKKS